MFALAISRFVSRAMALLYPTLHSGHLDFCLESLMVISPLWVPAKCLARLSGLLLCFAQFPNWHYHITFCPEM